MDIPERLQILLQWATSHGASLHDSVEIYDDAITGYSFRVRPSSTTSLAPWERVVSLPTSISLSYLNVLSPLNQQQQQQAVDGNGGLPSEVIASTPPHVLGRLFLAKQYLAGRQSFWWPYIQALPQPDIQGEGGGGEDWILPPFWPADDAELLEGTNVEIGLEKIRRDVRDEYSRASELLAVYGRDETEKKISMRLYQWAYCVFSSRSFRPSLVLSEQERQCLPAGVKIDDFSVLLPLFDIGNHDMTVDVRWELSSPTSPSAAGAVAGQNCCELRVGREFLPGQQVYNNYSMKTNAELLLGYGFMIPDSDDLHNDYTHVRKRTSTVQTPATHSGGNGGPSDEYYISRRPLSHPSSILGRYRQELVVTLPPGKSMLGAFQHVQADMVWDIFCTITPPEARAQLIPVQTSSSNGNTEEGEDEKQRQRKFFSGEIDPDSPAHTQLEHTMAIIQHKVMQELERLDETDVEVQPGDEAALTRNQRLALEYRQRCRAVLENTLEAMASGYD